MVHSHGIGITKQIRTNQIDIWHTLAGHDIEEMTKNGFDYLIPLWESIQNLPDVPKTKIVRCYFNAHTRGSS